MQPDPDSESTRLTVGVLEDDPTLRRFYDHALVRAGHLVCGYRQVSDFMFALQHERFDAFLLDWHLPDETAAGPLKWIRAHLGWAVPVIVVSADGSERSIIQALGAGADEYLVKPVRVPEALARIEAHLRRLTRKPVQTLRFGPFEVSPADGVMRVAGQPVPLTPKQFDVAALMFRNPGRLFSRLELMHQVWGTTADLETRTVDSHVSQLRRKAELDGRHGWAIRSIYGRGYRLEQVPGPIDAGSGTAPPGQQLPR